METTWNATPNHSPALTRTQVSTQSPTQGRSGYWEGSPAEFLTGMLEGWWPQDLVLPPLATGDVNDLRAAHAIAARDHFPHWFRERLPLRYVQLAVTGVSVQTIGRAGRLHHVTVWGQYDGHLAFPLPQDAAFPELGQAREFALGIPPAWQDLMVRHNERLGR